MDLDTTMVVTGVVVWITYMLAPKEFVCKETLILSQTFATKNALF